MRKLYCHENRMIIFNIKNLLLESGIEAVVMNEFASGGAGDLAAFDTWPEVWVNNDEQFCEAQKILNRVTGSTNEKEWFCRKCHEKNDSAFEICWQCGTECE
ncbi:MAG: hypothetical protein ACI845_001675 [Gammaproteobacteria bacterium]|jgi:hypothetical protein